MTKKSKLVLAMASMLGITAGATAVSGFAWFTTTKSATVDITNIGVYSKSSALNVTLKSADEGCTDSTATPSSASDINLVGAVAAAKTETILSDGTATVTLAQYPSAKPTLIQVGGEDKTSTTTWTTNTKTLTLAEAPAAQTVISVTYTPYAALTDVSSVDGQNIYKPTWTASGEGRYATAIPAASEGYIQFTMTLKASGASPLKVFLNKPNITAASGSTADTSAAAITRVALIEDDDQNPLTANTTKLVLQNSLSSNKGIDSSFAGSVNCRLDGTANPNDGWDLSLLTATVDSDIYAVPNATDKSNMSEAPEIDTAAKKALSNYVTTVAAGGQTDIIVSIWLEGTCGNTGSGPNGSFADSPENGMISVSLPLIAF